MEITWQPGVTLEQLEEQVIKKAFRFYDENKTRTAQALGISIRTLDSKLTAYSSGVKPEASSGKAEDPAPGVHLESPKVISPEHAMPVRKSKEVQEMPSRSLAAGPRQEPRREDRFLKPRKDSIRHAGK